MTTSASAAPLTTVRAAFARLAAAPGTSPAEGDDALDQLLGIDAARTELAVDLAAVRQHHGYQQTCYGGTSYRNISLAFHCLALTPKDRIYDLGCGYGRVLFCGALTTPAHFHGIEIVPERVAVARAVAARLALERVQLTAANVLDVDFRDGSHFFLCNPFSSTTLDAVLAILKQVAAERPIHLVSVAWSSLILAAQPWLQKVRLDPALAELAARSNLALFRS